LCFYTTVVRPVLEYACSVWHSSLTVSQYEALESLQKRAMRIIFNHDDYLTSLIIAGIDNLQTRREHLTEQFFLRNVIKEQSSLHYLLPTKRDLNMTSRNQPPPPLRLGWPNSPRRMKDSRYTPRNWVPGEQATSCSEQIHQVVSENT